MSDLTLEQQQALALARARRRKAEAAMRQPEAAQPEPEGNEPPEGFFLNPETGQMTSRETMKGYWDKELGRGEAAANTAAHGGTLGLTDEAAWIAGRFDSPEMAHAMKESQRAKIETAREKYPVQSFATEVAGSAAVPVSVLARTPTVAGVAAGGASTAGLYGAGETEGGVADRARGAVGPAIVGAPAAVAGIPAGKAVAWATQRGSKALARIFRGPKYYSPEKGLTDEGRKALQQMGFDPASVSKAFEDEFGVSLERGIAPKDAAAASELSQFGITPYRHNITQTADDFSQFERARHGGSGSKAESMARDAGDKQFREMQTAVDTEAARFSGGVKGDQVDASIAVSSRLDDLGKEAKSAASQAYSAAEAAGMAIDPDTAKGIVNRLQTRLADEEIDTTLDTFPRTRSFMSRLAKRGDGDKPVSLRLVDGLRKDLNKALRGNVDPEDARALEIIKAEYDDWLDEVVTAKLFSGDDGLPELKQARALYADYAQKYGGKGREAKFIQKMVDQEASPEEVARWLFGGAELGRGQMTSKLATALKDRLGAGSDEWNMLRQAAFRKMTQKPGTENPDAIIGMQWGPQKISENLLKFVNSPSTRPLAEALYTKEEIAQMRTFAVALKRMVPPSGSVNTSSTAYELSRMGQGAFRALASTLGLSAGGPAGAATADAAARSAGVARSWLLGKAVTSGAKRAPVKTGTTGARLGRGGASTTEERLNRPR